MQHETVPEALVAAIARTERREGLALEVNNHSRARAAAFETAGFAYVSIDGSGGTSRADPRHRLRGRFEEASFLPGDAFDAVVLIDEVERMRQPWAAAAQVARILRAGGWVYVDSALRPAHLADAEAPWTFGPPALRALFSALDERLCTLAPPQGGLAGDGGGRPERVQYLGVKDPDAGADAVSREPSAPGCPVCSGPVAGTGEHHVHYDEPLLGCTACGHVFVRATRAAPSPLPQSRTRADFYVRHVLAHLPVGSLLDLHPSPQGGLLALVRRQLTGVRLFAVGSSPAAEDTSEGAGVEEHVRFVARPAEAGQVDLAVGLLLLPFLPASELAGYVRTVARQARWFVFEVPLGGTSAAERQALLGDSTQRHLFSPRSLRLLFEGTGARVHAMAGFGPKRAPVLVAYRLPGDGVMSNGLVLEAD